MRGTLRPVPDLHAGAGRLFLRPLAIPVPRLHSIRSSALRPYSALDSVAIRVGRSQRGDGGCDQKQWRLPAWREHGGLGQMRMRHGEALVPEHVDESLEAQIDHCLRGTGKERLPIAGGDASWEAVLAVMRETHGADGVWACFQGLRDRGQVDLLAGDGAGSLCDEILQAALVKEDRMAALAEVAQQLSSQDFHWPDLYLKTIRFFLEQASYEAVVRWHLQLAPAFLPETKAFGALLASFVTNPTPKMQSTLTLLYAMRPGNLYDYLIPALFASGQSALALSWRKKLVRFEDHPSTSKSRQFLMFLSRYYPTVRLSSQELAVICADEQGVAEHDTTSAAEEPHGLQSDSIVAKWFASAWASADFAVHLAHKLGVRMIGPRSLQSLALREQGARDVAVRINQLGKLGIDIAPRIYCTVLVAFANKGEDGLLSDLLQCDVHPDEFEDAETRQMLLAEATRRGDSKRERLLQAVEWVVEAGPASHRLNVLLGSELLSNRGLGRARELVDRMGSLGVSMTQKSAMKLLRRATGHLGPHPRERRRKSPGDPMLDRAIDVVRRVSRHDVAIPVRYWKLLLYNLGRSRRLSQLEQLSLEIVRLYSPSYAGLIPVHAEDVPGDHLGVEERGCIPADLPFAHHCHPVRRIFDHRLQRCIVRWAFDQTLAVDPQLPALLNMRSSTASFAEYDVARGVRLLAQLRDRGVLVNAQVLQSSLVSRIALGQVPGRLRSRARDSNEMSVQSLEKLMEEAWGSNIFPSGRDMVQEVESWKPKLWKRYPRLFSRAYE